MIDLESISKYQENNRIEAKTALGGLPHSIWETYSAFANTLGGIILLGVREEKDKSFHTVNLPAPESLVREFWDSVNDPKTASVNILSRRDVRIETINGNRIIVINIPRADRCYKPVFVEGNPMNTYRRNGEGDYKCTAEEYQTMVRDASFQTQDMLLLEDSDPDMVCGKSLSGYRHLMKYSRPGHIWESLDDDEFLMKMGAAGIGKDGKIHLTCGGLLLFGKEKDIIRVFPEYSLEYRDFRNDYILSSSGDWSGNVMDFYFRVRRKLNSDMNIPCETHGIGKNSDTPLQFALREAFANSLVNADYYLGGGITVEKKKDQIIFSNPGTFRVDVEAAISGGVFDPRNNVIRNFFNMISIGDRAGSGIPNIFRVWRENNWQEPKITQAVGPDRTTLTLSFLPKVKKKASDRSVNNSELTMKQIKRQMIIAYLTEHRAASVADLASYLNLRVSRVREYLQELIAENVVIEEVKNKLRIYRLKA